MPKYTNEEILASAQNLANMIKDTEEVEFYKKAEIQINTNNKVKTMLASIKKLQKQAVNLQYFGKIEALKQTEAEINKLQQAIDEIPVVSEFKQSQVEVNDLLQMVTKTISSQVEETIHKELADKQTTKQKDDRLH